MGRPSRRIQRPEHASPGMPGTVEPALDQANLIAVAESNAP